MHFLVDESVDRQVVEHLRQEGHEVLYVAEMEPGLRDDEVLSAANQRGALLLTADKDFGELVFRLRRLSKGVVLLRLAGMSPEAKAVAVASVVSEHGSELSEAFTVLSPGMVRIRPRG
jgi:predicted nuclease of predicted toxin-antitoxin system